MGALDFTTSNFTGITGGKITSSNSTSYGKKSFLSLYSTYGSPKPFEAVLIFLYQPYY